MSFVAFTLPAPLSTNDLWRPIIRNVRTKGVVCGWKTLPGMIRTGEYEAWITEAGYALNRQKPTPIPGPYAITIQVSRAWKGDLGNAEKAVSDLLQKHDVIKNDRLAERIEISWIDADKLDGAGMSVLVIACKSQEREAA